MVCDSLSSYFLPPGHQCGLSVSYRALPFLQGHRDRVPRLVTCDLAASVESGRYLIPLLERELAKAFLRSVLAACTVSRSGAQTC